MHKIYLLFMLLGFGSSVILCNATEVNTRTESRSTFRDPLQLDTVVELRIIVSMIKDGMSKAHFNSRDRVINDLAFRLVLIAENETLDIKLLQAINEVENELGGESVTGPVYFKEERDAIDNQIKAGKEPVYRRTLRIFDFTRKIRELAANKGLPVPEYKGVMRGKL